MKKATSAALVVVTVSLASGCASTGVTSGTGPGLLYQINTEGVVATGVPLRQGHGVGVSCAKNVAGMLVYGDASIENARRIGNIEEIVSVERSYERILGIWGEMCTIVKGN